MPAYANARDTTSPTVPIARSATNSGTVTIYIVSSNTTTATADPWQTTPTACSNVTYISPASKPEVDWAALRYEARRAASMVPPPRENRAEMRRHLKVRKGFHQMCRLPCYRGARPR